MPQCFICSTQFNNYELLFLHFKIYHSHNISSYKCNEIDCYRSFDSLKSFKKHVKCHQSNSSERGDAFNVSSSSVNLVVQAASPLQNIEYNSDNLNSSHLHGMLADNFESLVYKNAIILLSKWYSQSGVPRNKVQFIIDDFTTFLNNCLPCINNAIKCLVQSQSINNNNILSKVDTFFNILSNPFKQLDTEYLRFKALDKSGFLIRPKAITIGNRLNDKLINGNVIVESIPLNVYSVPLNTLFKQLFECPNVLNMMLTHTEKLLKDNSGLTYSFIQSDIWRCKLEQNQNKILFPFILYFDEFETNNALGSHAGIQKLGAIYVSFPSFPPEYSSKLENIFLVLMFNHLDRKSVGNKETFKHLISDINYLESTGIDLIIENKLFKVYFSLALIVGDNLGLHSILGFSESFISNFPCRFCCCCKTDCQRLLYQTNDKLRTIENYNSDVNVQNVTLTGITELSVWNDIESFHVTNNLSVDLMHDLLEGVCNYDISGILRNLILDSKYLTIETLNNRIQFFDYGFIDIRNRPPLVSEFKLKSSHPLVCKMSAAEMWCFIRYFGLMVGDLIPSESEFWHLYILLRKIVDLTTSKCIGPECPLLLKVLIAEHNSLYMRLMNTSLKPKFHYLTHYPFIMEKVGPLINIWSMRFEGKHREFKMAAQAITSRKNICYTLTLKNQLKVAHQFSQNFKYDSESWFNVGKVKLYSSELKHDLAVKLNISSITNSQFVSWIEIKSTRYTNKNMTLVLDFSNFPVFGFLKYICVLPDLIPIAICELFITMGFDEHYQSYIVEKSTSVTSIAFKELPNYSPTLCCSHRNGLHYIPIKQ